MTAQALSLMLLAAGYAQPQADAIHAFMCQATCGDRKPSHRLTADLNPCARSRYGEGLVDVTASLRRELHEFAGVPMSECVPAERQIAFVRHAFPLHYPNCSMRFEAGDLTAFQRCWGWGHGR